MYEEHTKQFPALPAYEKHAINIKQIRKDRPRSVEESILELGNPNSPDINILQSTYRVCGAFYMHTGGYSQGMNFVALRLLMVLPEEEAFWMMVVFYQELLHTYHLKTKPFTQG